ncbi:hypothetical protein Aph01nite_43170 [Acrocarpospora phusangensis]|uniref:HNH nuclease domain-containing protein n=1 Tax=Acrocarpospora phusangensis TaxID=1070424 RepID=A0A919QGX0_9ACTN|nr:HNH endonuclease signature motif containing protein [Acrocarpospora phusangensis]GIH26007.1 hypothetical protein Aph01nite_43170 [Acrocarpospora phusangensis]
MKTRVRPCCPKETFATEEEARRRLDRVRSLGLSNPSPTGVKHCRNGWHLTYPATDTGPSDKTRAQVEGRDGYRCVRCGGPWVKGEDSIQHRIPRGRGGTNALENLLLLCGDGVTKCHGDVEHNRGEAYRAGYLVLTGLDPAAQPVLVHGRDWMLPTRDGSWATATEPGEAA